MKDCAIIIILYHVEPKEYFERLEPILNLGAQIYLVDNTPWPKEPACDYNPAPVSIDPKGIFHIPLGQNTGIAHALNVGVAAAFENNCRYVFTFDQDSAISPDLLLNLLAKYNSLEASGHRLLALGPHPVNKLTGTSYLRRRDRLRVWFNNWRFGGISRESWLMETSEIITSGLLANKLTYEAVGLYDEKLFIDFVDHDWCWRLRRKGGACVVNLSAQLEHMVGLGELPYTFGMKHGASHRLYYLFRNALFLIFRGRMPIFDSVKFIALIPAKIIIFSLMKDRWDRWRQIARGTLAGLRMACRGGRGTKA